MATPTVYPDRARVERRDVGRASVSVPHSGELAFKLRRRASSLLRARVVDGRRIRGVAIALQPGHLVVTIAGTPEGLDEWATGGRLARAAALAIAEAYDDARCASSRSGSKPMNSRARTA